MIVGNYQIDEHSGMMPDVRVPGADETWTWVNGYVVRRCADMQVVCFRLKYTDAVRAALTANRRDARGLW